jgi:hypothetical protein
MKIPVDRCSDGTGTEGHIGADAPVPLVMTVWERTGREALADGESAVVMPFNLHEAYPVFDGFVQACSNR